MKFVFGETSTGLTPIDYARTSTKEFVKSQLMLAFASPEAKGHRLSAIEALATYGIDSLLEIADKGYYPLVSNRAEPALTLKKRREQLGYTVKQLATLSSVHSNQIEIAEKPGTVSSVHFLQKLSPFLALDETLLGRGRAADEKLGVRLRTLSHSQDNSNSLSPTTVGRMAEAAWIIQKQTALAERLSTVKSTSRPRIKPSTDYGDYRVKTYVRGYDLAKSARTMLGFNQSEPLPKLRDIIEITLGIPLVAADLGQRVAGATILNGDARGIVVNIAGRNENVWVRRMTLAHELGHLLWDPVQALKSLAIDKYDEIEGTAELQDPVEMRANAFAIAFLAPPQEVERIFNGSTTHHGAIEAITNRFGISVTAAINHVWNICHTKVRLTSPLIRPSDEWVASENATIDYFPISTTGSARSGRFAWVVVSALKENLISLDTAAMLLKTDTETLQSKLPSIEDIMGVASPV